MSRRLFLVLLVSVVLSLFGLQPRIAYATPPPAWVTAMAWDGAQLWVGAHDGLRVWRDNRYTSHELPFDNPTVTALHHDGQALWAAGYDGVARWDGVRWQSWRNGENGLPRLWVTAFATVEGAVVVSTYGGGLLYYSDGGWQGWAVGGPRQIKALASDGVTLWATTHHQLWSWQTGRGWQAETTPESVTTIRSISYVNNALWLAGDGLWERHGTEWRSRQGADTFTTVTGHPDGPLVATRAGIFTPAVDTLTGPIAIVSHTVLAQTNPPHPIILLHGLNDSDNLGDSNMRFLAQWLREDGRSVYYAPYDESRSLWDNRAAINTVVQEARAAHNGAEVILIGHSFGGLVAKAYASQENGAGIAGMVTLGTPHGGARLIYDFLVRELDSDTTPPIRELLPEHAALLDPYWNLPTVPQLHIGGDALPRGGLLAGFPPNDGVVSAASAIAAPGSTRVIAALHGWNGPVLQYGIPTLTWPDNLHLTTLRGWLDTLPTNDTATRAPALRLPPAGFTQQQLFEGTLAAGETVTATVTLAEERVTWFVDSGGVQMTLIAPDGRRYEDETVRIVGDVVHLPYRENVLEPLDLWSTRQAGTWQAVLQNTTSESQPASVVLVNPARNGISLYIVNSWVAPSDTVGVVAQGDFTTAPLLRLGDVTYPMRQIIPMLYRADIPAPATVGYHALELESGATLRQAVVTVAPQGWQVGAMQSQRQPDHLQISLPLQGNGAVLLAVRYRVARETVWATITEPTVITEAQTLTYTLPLPPDNASVEWQLFDASGALMPITPRTLLTP